MTEAAPLSFDSVVPLPANEAERLDALRRYNILDTPPEVAFDRITSLAARMFGVPTVLISLVDESRAWFKSCYGFTQTEVARDMTICSFALLYDDILVVPNTQKDERFACNPFVQREPGLRFYAGAPLLTSDGFNLGTLCLLDTKPHETFTEDQRANLRDLAAMVMDELELRLAARKVAQVDAALFEVTQSVSAVTGQAFLHALVQNLSTVLAVDYVCISLLTDESAKSLKTLAFCAHGEIVDNVEYFIDGTPCLQAIRRRQMCCYPQAVQSLFPKDLFLVSEKIESYAALPFFNSKGEVLGVLGVMHTKPMEQMQLVQPLLPLFALRIAAELERQEAEDIRQQATQRLQLYANIVHNVQVGIVVWHLEDMDDPGSFRLMIANPAASEITGFDFEPTLSKTMAESFPSLLNKPLISRYLEVVREGRSLDLGEISYDEDGIFPGTYSLKAFPLPDHCLGLAFENITARKRVEAQLKESQRYSQQVAEAMPGILFVHDIIQQQNIYTNRQITDLLGYSSDQVQAMGADIIATLIYPDDVGRVFDYFESFRDLPDNIPLGIEYRAHHADGSWRWMYSQSVVFTRTSDGLPQQLLGVSVDITARKQSEQALQASEAWARLTAQVAQVGGWRLHLDTSLVEMDEWMRQIWGEPDDAVMIPLPLVLERMHPEDRERVASAINTAIDPASTGAYEIEYRIVWDDGTERWVSAKGQAQFEGVGEERHVIDFFGTALDITERKQAETAIVEQEQRYRYIFEAVSVAIWEEDFSETKAAIDQLKAMGVQDFQQYFADHPDVVWQMGALVRIRDVNQAALRMFGAQEKVELLDSLEQIFVPETEAAFIGELLAIANEEPVFAAETVLQTLQGDRLNVWFTITFPSSSDPYNHVLVSLIDITQRKQAEAALQESEERYRYLAEATPQVVWTTDANGMTTYLNTYWYNYTGMTEAESLGRGSPKALHPDDRDRVVQQWQAAVDTGAPYEVEFRLRRRDGVYHWFLCRGLPIRDANDQVVGWVGTNTDIEDQKQIQEALRQSEERLSLALRAAQAVTWQWRKSDNRSIWLDENFRLMGYEPGQVVPSYEAWFQALHPDDRDRVHQTVQQALEEDSAFYSEYRVCLPDGAVRWLADFGQITYDDRGNLEGMIGIQIDISKRKQSELERERSEAILNAFLAASPIALTLFDQDLRFLYANDALAQLSDLPLSEHLGRRLDEVLPGVSSQFAPMLQQAIESQEPFLNLEYAGELRPGVHRHMIVNHFPVCLPDGEVLGVGVTVVDISELKRVEADLRQSEERLSLALKAANQGLYDLNVQTGDAIVSPEYARMLGYEPEEFQETNAKWRDRLHPDDVGTVYRVYEEYIAGLHEDYRVEFRQRTKNGDWVWILSVGKIVSWDAEGNPLRMLGTHTDISERKRAEQALQRHSERLNLLYETTRELLSASQPLELMNRIFEKLSVQMDLHYYYHFRVRQQDGFQRLQLMNYQGLSEEQARSFSFIDFGQAMCGLVAQERQQIVLNEADIVVHPNAAAICAMGVKSYAGQPLAVHGRLLGTLSFASLTRTEFTDEEMYLLRAISEQVAIALDRAELVASLQQQTEDLAKANRVKDEFLAVLSHELRSPLNPILGWAKLLQTGRFDAQKTKQALEIIERNAKQQTQLIDDLLDISRILRGKLMLSRALVDLAFTIESALETVRLAAEAKNIQIKTDLSTSLPPVLGDAGRLQQVVLNLLSNAVKFTPNGGHIEVKLERVASEGATEWRSDAVEVWAEEDIAEPYTPEPLSSSYAQITVRDTGKGIDPSFLPHVFDSFRQEDSKTTRKFGGLGLGLAIVRQLTELHGGTVSVDSPGEGKGATFIIRLPLMQSQPAGLVHSSQIAPSQGANALGGIRVLVVDDEEDMRELAVTILEQAGAIVRVAASASEALDLLEQFQPTVLVSDVGMPEMDGYDLVRQIRARSTAMDRQIPAIALTAYAMEHDQQLAVAAGFQRHLAKPIEPDSLIQAIVALVE